MLTGSSPGDRSQQRAQRAATRRISWQLKSTAMTSIHHPHPPPPDRHSTYRLSDLWHKPPPPTRPTVRQLTLTPSFSLIEAPRECHVTLSHSLTGDAITLPTPRHTWYTVCSQISLLASSHVPPASHYGEVSAALIKPTLNHNDNDFKLVIWTDKPSRLVTN